MNNRFILLPYILNPYIFDTITNTKKVVNSVKDGMAEAELLNEEYGDNDEVLDEFIPRYYPGQDPT